MLRYCIVVPLFIISLVVFLSIGCRPNGSGARLHSDEDNKKATKEIMIGGKVWKVNPDLSYQATGVWTNPDPRPLTDIEQARLKAIIAQTQALRAQLNELNARLRQFNRESNALRRIEQPEIKVRYRFGKPPHLGTGNIFDLGEFTMELENGEFRMEMDTSKEKHLE